MNRPEMPPTCIAGEVRPGDVLRVPTFGELHVTAATSRQSNGLGTVILTFEGVTLKLGFHTPLTRLEAAEVAGA